MLQTTDWKSYAGMLSDREIARKFGVGATTVRRYRKANNIAEYCYKLELPPSLIVRLVTETDYSLSKELGIPAKRLKETRLKLNIPEPKVNRPKFQPLEDIWNEETIALLGTMPDYELADRLRVSNYPIKAKRKELGIRAYKKPYPEITPALAAEFGVTSDRALAERLGVSASFIRNARQRGWSKMV